MSEQKTETPEELQAWAIKKREQQAKAWKKWNDSPKGAAYRQRRKEQKAMSNEG